VPVTLGIGQPVKWGKQPVNLQATAYYNVVKPTDAGNWTLELTVQFLFPKNFSTGKPESIVEI